MKKVLSFVLVLAMILGCTSMAFAAPWTASTKKVTADNTAVPFADAEDSYVATILRDLGAVDGDGTGNVNLEGELTRAEGFTLIVKAMGLKAQGEVKQATKFTDVDKDAWYSGYVAVAAAQGYTSGTGNKKFSPDAKMSRDEAVAALLKVLGYADEHLEGSWPANYRDLALKEEILTDVDMGTDVATRGDMLQVIFNCLNKQNKVWKENALIGGGYTTATNSVTLLQRMTGVQNAYVYAEGAAKVLETKEFKNGFDASAYYGKYVETLKKKGTDIGLWKVSSKTLVGSFESTTTFKAVDGTKYTIDLTTDAAANLGGDVYHFTNGAESDAANVVVDFTTKGATSAEGWEITGTPKASKVALEVKFDTTKKKIVAIYSSTYDVAENSFMATQAQVDVIAKALENKVSKTDVQLLGTHKFAVTKSGVYYVPDTTTFTVEGDAETLADIQKDDVVTLYKSGGKSTNAVVKVVVTRDTVEGTVTRVKSTDKFSIDGTEYTKAKDAGTAAAPYNGQPVANDVTSKSSFKLYLDEDGKVYGAERLSGFTTTTQTAFILNTYEVVGNKVNGSSKTTYSVDFLGLDGTVATYDVASMKALSMSETIVSADGIGWADGKQTEMLVDYTLDKDGKIASLSPAALVVDDMTTLSAMNSYATAKKSGLTASYNYANPTVIFLDNDVVSTKATHYVAGTLADLIGYDWKDADYRLNKAGKIDLVVVALKGNVDTTKDDSTIYGFISDYSEAAEDGKAEIYVLGNDTPFKTTATFADTDVNYTSFFAFTLVNGKVDAINEYTTDNAVASAVEMEFSTPEAIEFGEYLFTVSGPAVLKADGGLTGSAFSGGTFAKANEQLTFKLAENAVYYTYVKGTATVPAHYEVAGDMYEIGNAASVQLFDLNKKADGSYYDDAIFDVVVIVLPEE